jgi:hypothetical protein
LQTTSRCLHAFPSFTSTRPGLVAQLCSTSQSTGLQEGQVCPVNSHCAIDPLSIPICLSFLPDFKAPEA